jgi:hypothetical protein
MCSGKVSSLSWKISPLLQSRTSGGWKKRGQERNGQHPHGRPSFATRTTNWERGDGRSQRQTHVTSRGSKRDGDASRFRAEKIRAGGKWKEFHQNGGSPVWYHQILASGVSKGMIWKLHWIAFLFPTRKMFHGPYSQIQHFWGYSWLWSWENVYQCHNLTYNLFTIFFKLC